MCETFAFRRYAVRLIPVSIALALTLCFATTCPAIELFNTLPTPLADTNLGYGSLSNTTIAYAQSFSTSAESYVLTGVTLRLSSNATTGSFRVSIYGFDTATNAPSSSLFSSVIFEGFPTGVTFTGADVLFPVNDLTLEPSKRYYVVASNSNITPGLAWGDSQNNKAVGTNYSNEFYAGSNTSGATWSFAPPVQSNIAPFIMQVTAVPEPSSFLMAIASAGITAWVVRRRNRARNSAEIAE